MEKYKKAVIEEIQKLVQMNNVKDSTLYIELGREENGNFSIIINGNKKIYNIDFSVGYIHELVKELENIGGEIDLSKQFKVVFYDPCLLVNAKLNEVRNALKDEFIQDDKIIIPAGIIEDRLDVDVDSVIDQIRRIASVNNKNSSVLYISIKRERNSIYIVVNGEGAIYNLNISNEKIKSILNKLIELGAKVNPSFENAVMFDNPSLLFSIGQTEKENNIEPETNKVISDIQSVARKLCEQYQYDNMFVTVYKADNNCLAYRLRSFGGPSFDFVSNHQYSNYLMKSVISKLTNVGAYIDVSAENLVIFNNNNWLFEDEKVPKMK